MSTIRISTNFNIDVEFPAASFHRRLLAWIIDIAVLIFYILILLKAISLVSIGNGSEERNETYLAIVILLVVIPAFLYHPLCETLLKGQSAGKRITGIKVINEYGGRPSFSQVVIRWIIRTSDNMVLAIFINAAAGGAQSLQYLWSVGITFGLLATDIILVNATRRHQRLGDILAHTMLIRTTQKAAIEDTIFLNIRDNYTPSYPQVMRLSDRDINSLKGILDAAKRGNDYYLAERAAEKIKAHLKIETSVSAFDFLETLLKDYNYLSAH